MTPRTSQSPSTQGISSPPPEVLLRPLRPEDLEAVVALDKASAGMPRRPYFEKRLQAALRHPKRHLQLALATGKGLAGFLVARIADGEYGRPKGVVILEAVSVDPALRHSGLGRRMLSGIEELMKGRGIGELVTQVDWRNHTMLKFLDGAGFSLAPRNILERSLERLPLPTDENNMEQWPQQVRQLRADDFEAVRRIDRRVSGSDRTEYLQRKFDEALQQSAIAVSLAAEEKGFVVAFAMARVDFGDFGRIEPGAALDTIGVDPSFAGKGYGRALLSQMVENLAALQVERLETEVARENFELLKFLYALGFGPSQRLSFQKVRP